MQRTVLSLIAASLGSLSASEIVDWDFAINSDGDTAEAVLTAVEAVALTSGTRAFSSGHFQGELSFPGVSNPLFSEEKLAGLVVQKKANSNGGYDVQWVTQSFSNEDVQLYDLALTENSGLIYVAGSHLDEVFFGPDQSAYLPPANTGAVEGFVAVLDQDSGDWQAVFSLGEIIPRSIALDDADCFYITSEQKLVAKFDQAGNPLWGLDADGDTLAAQQIALLPIAEGKAESFILTSVQGGAGNGRDVRLSAVSTNGSLMWQNDVTSSSDNQAGGLGISRQGLLSFSVTTNDDQVNYDGFLLDDEPSPLGVPEVYLVRVRPDSSFIWSTRVAAGDDSSSTMMSTDLAHDPQGNVHLAIDFSGPFTFEGRTRFGNGDTGILSVGDGGIPYHLIESSGSPLAQARGISAPQRNEQILVGKHQGRGTILFGSDSLSSGSKPRLFAAFAKNALAQSCYIIRQPDNDPTPPNLFLENLRAVLQGQQGATPQISTPAEIYREFNFPNLLPGAAGNDIGVVGFAAFISDQDIDIVASSPQFQVEEDLLFTPTGTTSPAPPNLARMNNASATGPFSYTFPQMCQAVRLYLIDTAVSDPGGSYFAGNLQLTLLDPIVGGFGELVRAPMETAGIVTAEHGTSLLSLVAGPDLGVAQDTPITTKVYDIFPSLEEARASALIEALLLARLDRLDPANLYVPSLLLIASNSATTVSAGDLPALEIAIDACSAVGIPIVMSAGNDGAAAADYAPAKFGDRPGILCTGATNAAGGFLPLSNRGPEVKILAPGENTVVASEVANAFTTTTFTGTSASAALTMGALIHFQSANPWLLGSDLVAEFLTHSTHPSLVSFGGQNYAQAKASATRPGCFSGYSDWISWFALTATDYGDNSDGDPYSNLEEYVHGLDPKTPQGLSDGFGIDDFSNPSLTMGLPVAWWLWDPSAAADADEYYLLRDGATRLRVASSNDLGTFLGEPVSFVSDDVCATQTRLTFEKDVTLAAKKFFRVESTGP